MASRHGGLYNCNYNCSCNHHTSYFNFFLDCFKRISAPAVSHCTKGITSILKRTFLRNNTMKIIHSEGKLQPMVEYIGRISRKQYTYRGRYTNDNSFFAKNLFPIKISVNTSRLKFKNIYN